MSPRLVALAIALAAAGAAYGVYSAGVTADRAEAAQSAEWTDPPAPVDYSQAGAQFYYAMERSGVFPLPPPAAVPAEAPPPDPAETFPTIISVAMIDGKANAYLRDSAGARMTAQAGIELPGGWKVKSVSLEKVIAEREGETHTFEVYPRAPNE